ncbi:helicase-associated domain-containing protein [Nocardioides montaniterrae]
METERHRSLADQLRSWADADVARLLADRPDLATPAPSDFGHLASRATAQNSISRALDILTRGELLVLDALVSAGQTTDAELRDRLDAEAAYVDGVMARLRGLALAWDSPEGLRAVRGAADLLAATPSLRDGREGPIDVVPEIATAPVMARLVDNAALGSATDVVRRTELLLDWWGLRPGAALRTTGLTARELKATAGHLGITEREAAVLIEVAVAAGLAATRADSDGNPVWVPSDAYDRWRDGTLAERWTRLAKAWLASTRLPSLVGERGPDGKTWNALVPELSAIGMPEAKSMALTELAGLPEAQALAAGTGLPSLIARLTWLRPRRPRTRPELIGWAVAEAALLGITGAEALSSFGRLLAAGEDPAERLDALLPPPVDHVLIQADLTAVAPGPLESPLERQLQQLADLESHGSATVYRFTRDSVRRALDIGWSGAEIHAFLATSSRTEVPQPLSYLVDDTVRSFGRLRVGVATGFIRSDDEVALAELLRHPKAPALGLRRIAPTVVVTTTPVDVLLPRLRELGLSPVVEGADGVVRVGAADSLRARTPKSSGPTAAAGDARRAAQVAVALRHLREGDAEAAARPATSGSPATALSALRDAIERGATVRIGHLDNRGLVIEREVRPVSVEGGQLTAYDVDEADIERHFPIHRVTKVEPVS